LYRKLTPQQNALFKAYAEMERDVEGTVNGVTDTQSGNYNFVSVLMAAICLKQLD